MKVVGARMSHQLGVLAYTLSEPTKKQSFQFTYTAGRLEVKVPPRPQLPLSLPPDLFYPFTIGSAGMPALHLGLIVTLWVVQLAGWA
eukprot:symbB.v1.2.025303.t1/scaffold2445.1/size151041/31